jgi:flagellar biogenesis protein FliO
MGKITVVLGLLVLMFWAGGAYAQITEEASEAPDAVLGAEKVALPQEASASGSLEPDWLASEAAVAGESPMLNSGLRAGGALVVVVCLLWLTKVLISRRASFSQPGREPIQLLGAAKLGGASTVHLLDVEGSRLLVGASQSGVNLIALLEKPAAREQGRSDRQRQPKALEYEEELLETEDWPRAARPQAAGSRPADRPIQEPEDPMETLLRRKIAELRGRSATLA